MTTARSKIVDLEVTRYYHCTSRCVRGAFLCGKGFEHRKQWIEARLEHLASCFSISVASFAVMDNHLHVLVRIDSEEAERWSDEEVIRRWISVYPPRGVDLDDELSVQKWIEIHGSPQKVAFYRNNLTNLGWFMKALKEPLARFANQEDGCKGAFWEGRYKSSAVVDVEGVLSTCVYIDLNPVAAGVAKTPENSQYTSVRQRVQHCHQKKKSHLLKTAQKGSIAASRRLGNMEQDHWLIPFEDRRPHTNSKPASQREGLLEKFTFGNYLILLEYTGRMYREGKANISAGLNDIFERLDSSVAFWTDQLKNLLSAKELRGRCYAGSRKGISPETHKRYSTRVHNLSPQS